MKNEMQRTKEHEKEFEALAQSIGIEKLVKLIPFTFERVQAALAGGDKHLNTIPLHLWDQAAGGIVKYGWQLPDIFRGMKDNSLSARVCVLKHVAKFHLQAPEQVKPETPQVLTPVAPFVPSAPIDYHAQAETFLAKFGIKFRATLSDSKVAPWHDELKKHGQTEPHHFRVTLSKGKPCTPEYTGNIRSAARLTFDFWSSIADAEAGIKTVSAYSVLSCISGDCNTPDTFKEFCADMGFDADSIKALQTFRRCSAFSKRLNAFFTKAEIEALREIQ